MLQSPDVVCTYVTRVPMTQVWQVSIYVAATYIAQPVTVLPAAPAQLTFCTGTHVYTASQNLLTHSTTTAIATAAFHAMQC